MSKGPGRIERAIRELFRRTPRARLRYGRTGRALLPDVVVGRKHQVSVLRAAWNVIRNVRRTDGKPERETRHNPKINNLALPADNYVARQCTLVL
jgi:hypothetical protein